MKMDYSHKNRSPCISNGFSMGWCEYAISPMGVDGLSTSQSVGVILRILDVTKYEKKEKTIYYRYKTINEIVECTEELFHFVKSFSSRILSSQAGSHVEPKKKRNFMTKFSRSKIQKNAQHQRKWAICMHQRQKNTLHAKIEKKRPKHFYPMCLILNSKD